MRDLPRNRFIGSDDDTTEDEVSAASEWLLDGDGGDGDQEPSPQPPAFELSEEQSLALLLGIIGIIAS